MNAKYFSAVAIAAVLTVGAVGCGGGTEPGADTTEEVDPCAATEDPCAADPCAAEEDPCAADPCAGS